MVLLESNHTLKTGQKAPDFDLPGIDGSKAFPVKLRQL